MQKFDIVILGGGLVGGASAIALAKLGFKIAIIDKISEENLYPEHLDNKGIALAKFSLDILEDLELDILKNIIENSYKIKEVHVSEKNKFGFTKLTGDSIGSDIVGIVTSAKTIAKALYEKISIIKNITSFRPNSIDNINNNIINLDNNVKLESKLIIAADGTNSFLRKYYNISVKTYDYNQSAIVCNINTKRLHNNIAYERFTKDGIIAVLPFGIKTMKLVWTVDNDYLPCVMDPNFNFIDKIQQNFGKRLGVLELASEKIYFPLKKITANNLYKNNMVLLGNAANTLHPVAAQGLNLGLRDIYYLCKAIKMANKFDNDSINSILSNYVELRKKDHITTIQGSHFLNSIFSKNNFPMSYIRQKCLMASQLVPYVNSWLAKRGMGYII